MRQFSILKGEGENQAEDASANGKNMEIWHRKSFSWGQNKGAFHKQKKIYRFF